MQGSPNRVLAPGAGGNSLYLLDPNILVSSSPPSGLISVLINFHKYDPRIKGRMYARKCMPSTGATDMVINTGVWRLIKEPEG